MGFNCSLTIPLRRQFRRDYHVSALTDACTDQDPEVHALLIFKVFPGQAGISTAGWWAEKVNVPRG